MRSAVKTLTGLVLAAALPWTAPAKANEIDLSTWTCKQFQYASENEVTLILAWLDGYYRGEDDPPIIDPNQLAANAKNPRHLLRRPSGCQADCRR